jgi:hypothetical protein
MAGSAAARIETTRGEEEKPMTTVQREAVLNGTINSPVKGRASMSNRPRSPPTLKDIINSIMNLEAAESSSKSMVEQQATLIELLCT